MTSLRVLIVDDEPAVARTLAECLGRRDLVVDIAESGEGALAALEIDVRDIVVLDVRMPGMSGIDTLGEIRRRFPRVGVVMLSGHADINTAVSAMNLGAFDYLLKPVQIDALFFRIQDAYNTQRLTASSSEVS